MTKKYSNVFTTKGASNHTKDIREINDFYATSPIAIEKLLELEKFNKNIWEPCCGQGHLSKILIKNNYKVKSTDLINRNFGKSNIDFLKQTKIFNGDIITNPPYQLAQEIIQKSLDLLPNGFRCAHIVNLSFLESKGRKLFFKNNPPQYVYVSCSRILMGKNGIFPAGSAIAYCWIIWKKGFKGQTILKWFN